MCSGLLREHNNSQWLFYSHHAQKLTFHEMRDSDTITRKVCVDGNKFALEKNGGYTPSSSDGRSVSVGRQTMSE